MKKINELINYIKSFQHLNGSFLLCKPDDKNGYESPLATAIVLDVLSGLKSDETVEAIKKRAADFLMKSGTNWEFSAIDDVQNQTFLVDRDLRTTFLVLSSLMKYDSGIFDGGAIAKILQILIDNEVDEGGPYYTGLKEHSDSSINFNTNVQIRNYLTLNEVDLPKLDSYIEENLKIIIEGQAFSEKEICAVYFLSKNYSKKNNGALIKRLQAVLKEQSGNPLMVSMLVSALINLGQTPEQLKKEFDYLFHLEKDEFEDDYPLFSVFDSKSKKEINFGSSAINISVYLEVLNSFVGITRGVGDDNSCAKGDAIYETIISKSRKGFEQAGDDLKKFSNKVLDKIIGFDKDKQIGLVPFKFREALGEIGEKISDEMIIDLGVANVYIWMAYTIYDDFLDDEGDVKFLSVANFCLREFTAIYSALMPTNNEFKIIFDQVMNQLDSANAWEVTHARALVSKGIFHIPENIPDYHDFGKLAERSLAHGLGPIAILTHLGYKHDSIEVLGLLSFFKHYLIARQLNDDAHDWEEDLKRGHIDAVVALILKKITDQRNAVPGRFKNMINIEEDLVVLQKDFWLKMISEVSEIVLSNIKKAKASLAKTALVKKPECLLMFLSSTENAATKAIREHRQAMEFLEHYQE